MLRVSSLLALFVTLLATGCHDEPTVQAGAALPSVTVGQVVLRRLEGGLTASGQLVAREEASVASELSGYRIARVLVEENARVARGQALAVLDDALLRPQLDQARATLQQQQVAALRATGEAERVRGLDDKGVLSNEAIAERRLGARTAATQVAVAQAQLRDLQVRRDRMIVRAPVAGRILQRDARPGDTAQAGTILFRIARGDLVELDAELPEASASDVKIGDPATVTLASGATIEGHVRLIGARVDVQTGQVRVRIALPMRDDLRPGGFAKAVFRTTDRPVPTVPEAAIRFGANGSSVQMLGADNRVKSIPVRTGARAGGFVTLTDGPPPGTRVVLGGGAFVLEGDKVNPVTKAAR